MGLIYRGMYGIGDNLHQRAVLRAAMAQGPVVLETFYHAMYHDLVARGLKLRRLMGYPPRIRERTKFTDYHNPGNRNYAKITYDTGRIHAYGSILAAQFSSVGRTMPERPDFSLPVPQSWRNWAREVVGSVSKPLLLYRPIVLNDVWRAEARAPDPALYAALFRLIRDRYHVVSVANLGDNGEYIVGEEQDADSNFNRGELDFETMTGLFAEASLSFTCPGFAPVLSQAVGTKTVIVYGANERHTTTNIVGEHLALTLAIEPDVPCDHHLKNCGCSKHITLVPAFARLEEFVTCAC